MSSTESVRPKHNFILSETVWMPDSTSPLYAADACALAFQLRYAWTGWPSGDKFDHTLQQLIEDTKSLWETDGLRVLQHRWTDDQIQILFSVTPDVSPLFVATRAKGRLDHAIRTAGETLPFSRKVALRAVGDNTREDIEGYIRQQVAQERFVDPQFSEMLSQFTVAVNEVDLSQPSETARGRYWFNLHVVLVTDQRYRFTDEKTLQQLFDGVFRIARNKEHLISSLSVMPDHVHIALRPKIDEKPAQVARSYQNNLAYFLNRGRIWEDSFYVGTFGEYTTQAVRKKTTSS